jgi:glycerol uptake facilitator-like aquaporin
MNRRNGLPRRLLAEFLGTALLVTVVVGSGAAAQNLTRDPGVQLLENALVTAAGLAVLILMLGPISGAHFNPLVSGADWLLGRRTRTGLASADLGPYVAAQVLGAIVGAVLANEMFAAGFVHWSQHVRSGAHLWLGEIVATAGLLLLIVSLARQGRTTQAPWAVGAYIGAAYWFTSSTSFANPAVSVGRTFTDTFAGIAPRSLPGFITAQVIGAVIGVALVALLYPHVAESVDELVVPHE